MPLPLGKHNPRLQMLRALRTNQGRSDQQKFIFEGWTLLHEALTSGLAIDALYVTPVALDNHPSIGQMENTLAVYVVDQGTFERLSDVQSPSGILAVAATQLVPVTDLLTEPGHVLLLADLSDPGNAGTLIRSAEAFGVKRVIMGSLGVQPYHPKLVRSAMGSLFRMRLALASPDAVAAAARARGFRIFGTDAQGEPIDRTPLPPSTVLAVGQERRGLGEWSAVCERLVGIPMVGRLDSLNAAVAGSIVLYEASKRGLLHHDEPVKIV